MNRRAAFFFVFCLVLPQAAFAWTHGAVSGTAPANTSLPTIVSSSPVVGTPETISVGSWSGAPTITYTCQVNWADTGAPISGATSCSTYTPVSGDVGHTLDVTVTASNGVGSTPATSTATGAVTSGTFTPTFQTAKISSGGLLNNISASPSDGTMVLSANTYGAYLYRATGTCAGTASGGWGTSYPAPCWEQLFTAQSISGWTIANADNLGQGVLEVESCNNNTTDGFAFFNGNLWVTTTLTGSASSRSWVKTPLTNSINGNQGISAGSSHAIGCDPANPNVVYAGVPGALKVSGNALSGASSSFATVSGVGTTGTLPSLIAFDPGSTTGACAAISGSPTCSQHFFVFTDGTGLYETYNGGTSFTLTSSGPTTITGAYGHMNADKYDNVFVSINDTHLYKYVPNGTAGGGTWTTQTPGAINSVVNFAIDPTAASSTTERIAASGSDGNIAVTTTTGAAWTAASLSVTTGNTFAAPSPQPAWMGNAVQYGSNGNYIYIDTQDFAFDNSGNLWSAAGIGAWEMSVGGIITHGVWNANSIGIEQLVANWIVSAPGNAPVAAVWDRGFFALQNPDAFPSNYWPDFTYSNTYGAINGGWALTYASYNAAGSPCGVSCNFFVGWIAQSNNLGASSADGGKTWTAWPTQPAGTNIGGAIAAASQTNWIVNPGFNQGLYYTTNAGGTWTPLTISGAATPWSNDGGRESIAADTVAATTYCIVDNSLNFYSSTTATPSFTKVASAGATDGGAYNDKLKAVPGISGAFFYSGGNNGGSNTGFHLWKSTNTCGTWVDVDTGLTNVYGYGFGAAKPGGSGVPVIYAYATIGGVAGIYENDDLATTTTWTLVPNSTLASNSLDFVKDVSGDMNVYGRVYIGFNGSGYAYEDTANACPWVNFTTIFATNNITGTVTLTSAHSGLVPVTSVQYSVDGTNIGSALSGAGPYSYGWVTGGVATGAHVLKVTATGATCNGAFSIPITTH
jgi:hypothetical protein